MWSIDIETTYRIQKKIIKMKESDQESLYYWYQQFKKEELEGCHQNWLEILKMNSVIPQDLSTQEDKICELSTNEPNNLPSFREDISLLRDNSSFFDLVNTKSVRSKQSRLGSAAGRRFLKPNFSTSENKTSEIALSLGVQPYNSASSWTSLLTPNATLLKSALKPSNNKNLSHLENNDEPCPDNNNLLAKRIVTKSLFNSDAHSTEVLDKTSDTSFIPIENHEAVKNDVKGNSSISLKDASCLNEAISLTEMLSNHSGVHVYSSTPILGKSLHSKILKERNSPLIVDDGDCSKGKNDFRKSNSSSNSPCGKKSRENNELLCLKKKNCQKFIYPIMDKNLNVGQVINTDGLIKPYSPKSRSEKERSEINFLSNNEGMDICPKNDLILGCSLLPRVSEESVTKESTSQNPHNSINDMDVSHSVFSREIDEKHTEVLPIKPWPEKCKLDTSMPSPVADANQPETGKVYKKEISIMSPNEEHISQKCELSPLNFTKLEGNISESKNFSGFCNASGRRIEVSDDALCKSHFFWKETNDSRECHVSENHHDTSSININSNKLANVEKTELIDSNGSYHLHSTPSTSHFSNNNVVEFCNLSKRKRKKLNSENSALRIINQKTIQGQCKSEFETLDLPCNESEIGSPHKNDRNFPTFKTASDKQIKINPDFLLKAKSLWQETDNYDASIQLDSPTTSKNIQGQCKNKFETTDLPCNESEIGSPHKNDRNFPTFKTASDKQIKINPDFLLKAKSLWQETDNYDASIQLDSPTTSKNIQGQCKNKFETIDLPYNESEIESPPKDDRNFPTFKTASNKQIKINPDFLLKAKSLWQETDNYDASIQLDSRTTSKNTQGQCKSKFETIDLPCNESQIESPPKNYLNFPTFKTASNKQIKINPDLLLKAKGLWQETENHDASIQRDSRSVSETMCFDKPSEVEDPNGHQKSRQDSVSPILGSQKHKRSCSSSVKSQTGNFKYSEQPKSLGCYKKVYPKKPTSKLSQGKFKTLLNSQEKSNDLRISSRMNLQSEFCLNPEMVTPIKHSPPKLLDRPTSQNLVSDCIMDHQLQGLRSIKNVCDSSEKKTYNTQENIEISEITEAFLLDTSWDNIHSDKKL